MNALGSPNSQDEQNHLPRGWVQTTVGTIFTVVGGGTPSTARTDYWDGSIPWITSADIDEGGKIRPRKKITEQGIADSATNRVPPGSVIVVTRVGLGKVGLAREELCFSQDSQGLIFSDDHCYPPFVAYQMQVLVSVFKHISRGTTISGVTKKQLLDLRFKLPPLSEQYRIVAAIETQFTRLDAAVTALRRVQANLKRYRASVLQAAGAGRLVPTEAELAHAEGRSYEPADQLLQRILQERRVQWEAEQLAHMQAQGRVPKDDKWKSKYKEPVTPDTRELPVLPAGWVWANLSAIADLKGGITKGQKRRSNDILHSVPYLRVANVQRGFLDLTDIKQIEATEAEIKELLLSPGDILFNEGGDRDKLGRGWVWRGEISNCIHQNHVFRARLYLQDLQPKFVSWYGNSCGQQYFMNEGKQTTNLASINLTKLGALPVPLPPLPEQHRIVAEVDRCLSVIDELEAVIAANLKRAERLRQAILKRAFEGKLVPQDPAAEPASVLLERIRAERPQPKAAPKIPQKSLSPPRTVQPTTATPIQGELALQHRA